MNPRAFLVRSLVPAVTLAREAEDLGLYAAAAARSWAHFPHMLRVDGLTMGQLKALREKARLLDIPAAEAMPYRHREDWSEGLVLSADTTRLGALARDVSIDYASVGRALTDLLEALANRTRRLNLKSGEVLLEGDPGVLLMGILNVTPDSFSDGGQHAEVEAAVSRALKMVEDGARLIDVGGESTRPGALPVLAGEELKRVIPVIERLRAALPPEVHIGVDTMKAEVARAAAKAGAEIVNDVSGLSADPAMRGTVAELGVHAVINHMRGSPRTMQEGPAYRHVIPEIIADLSFLAGEAMRHGIDRDRIILDPGLGFGKRHADNLAILRHLPTFVSLGRPVLLGVSRKSFLGKIAGDDGAATTERADATLAAEALAVAGGVHILRTHEPLRAALAARVGAAFAGRYPREDAREAPPVV